MTKREQVVQEAISWRGTPYILKGRVKGAGADCFTFPAEVMIACGLFTMEALPPYHHDWFLHTTEEHYIKLLWKHATEIITGVCWPTLKVEPGNLVVVRAFSARVFNHSAIVLKWPRCIHCTGDGGVCEFDIHRDAMWSFREVKVFDPFYKIGFTDPFIPEPEGAL